MSCRTVTDMSINPLGLVIAGISVITSGMQQILCGTVQRKHNLTSMQLLSNTAPIQVSPCSRSIRHPLHAHPMQRITLPTPCTLSMRCRA